MGEIKQTNFRINQEAADSFRSFCEEQGFSQAQGFDHLLQVLELDQAKTAVPERSLEIADFEAHVKAVLSAYIQSITIAQNTEARVHDEFVRRLESRDQTIQDLQEDLKTAKKELEEYSGMEAKLLNAQLELAETQSNMRVLEDQCSKREADKQQIVDMLTEKLADAEKKATGYDALKSAYEAMAVELKAAQEANKDLKREHEIQAERAAHEAEKAMVAAVAGVKSEADANLAKLRDELHTVQIKAAEDLRVAEEKAHEADKTAAAEIRKLEAEKAALREELVQLKAGK